MTLYGASPGGIGGKHRLPLAPIHGSGGRFEVMYSASHGRDQEFIRNVVVLGGGVAGIETLLALHDLAGEPARITLVAPDPDFVYKPLLVEEPFGLGPPEQRALAPVADERGAQFVLDEATAVRPHEHRVELARSVALSTTTSSWQWVAASAPPTRAR